MADRYPSNPNGGSSRPQRYVPSVDDNPYASNGAGATSRAQYSNQQQYAGQQQAGSSSYTPHTHARQGYAAPVSRHQYNTSGRDYTPYTSGGPNGHGRAPKRRSHAGRNAAIAIVFAAIACVGVYLFLNPPFYEVTINGATHTVDAGTTINTVIEKGYASPTAGDLMAVDGSVAQAGGGQPFVATIGDTTTSDPNTPVTKGMSVQIENGGNTEEESTTTTETITAPTDGGIEATASSYYVGPIHVMSAGSDGEQVVKTGNVSGKTVTEVTKPAISAGYHAYDAHVNGEKVVALTFDDGPWSTTDQLLDVLAANDAKATFFMIGNQISEYPDTVKRIASEGHQLATHTWDHAAGSGQGVNLTYMTAEEQVQEVEKGFKAIDDLLGTKVERIMRAPGGNYYGSLVTTLQPYVTAEIGWDLDTEDWRRPGADAIAQVIKSATPGAVILMHDGGGDRTQTIEALKTALPYLKNEGYKFITVSELMAYGADTTA